MDAVKGGAIRRVHMLPIPVQRQVRSFLWDHFGNHLGISLETILGPFGRSFEDPLEHPLRIILETILEAFMTILRNHFGSHF